TYYLRECTDRENLPVVFVREGRGPCVFDGQRAAGVSSVLVQGPSFRGRRSVAKQAFEVGVQEHSFGVQLGPQTQKIIPARISRSQLSGRHRVQLAPVRAPLMLLEDFFDCREVLPVWHPAIHMDGYIGRVAAHRRAEPYVVGPNKSALDREVHGKAV